MQRLYLLNACSHFYPISLFPPGKGRNTMSPPLSQNHCKLARSLLLVDSVILKKKKKWLGVWRKMCLCLWHLVISVWLPHCSHQFQDKIGGWEGGGGHYHYLSHPTLPRQSPGPGCPETYPSQKRTLSFYWNNTLTAKSDYLYCKSGESHSVQYRLLGRPAFTWKKKL